MAFVQPTPRRDLTEIPPEPQLEDKARTGIAVGLVIAFIAVIVAFSAFWIFVPDKAGTEAPDDTVPPPPTGDRGSPAPR